MTNNRLNLAPASENASTNPCNSSRSSVSERKLTLQAKMERLWLECPEKFNPNRNVMEKVRLARTLELIKQMTGLKEKSVADIGCGAGVFSIKLKDEGANVHAVDIAANALKLLKQSCPEMKSSQDGMPCTRLDDDSYDIVVCTEVISYLDANDQRLFFSELARIVKPNGYVVCSTALDINTEDPAAKFSELAETELQIDKWAFSHHRLYIRMKDFIEAPLRYAKARTDPGYRAGRLKELRGLGRWWFRFNSSFIMGLFWSLLQYPVRPLVYLFDSNKTLLYTLEKVCKFFWAQEGISQAIFIGQRRPIVEALPKDEYPKEQKHKKMVWE